VVFLLLSFYFVNKILVSFKFRIDIILLTLCAHTHLFYIRSHFNFSIGIRAGTLRLKYLIPECNPYLFVNYIYFFYYTSLSWILLSYLMRILILSSLKFLLNWIKWFLQKNSKRWSKKKSYWLYNCLNHMF